MVGRVLMVLAVVLAAFAVLYGCGQASSPAEHRTTAVGAGSTTQRCPDAGACAEPNAKPVPDVVGLPVLAACRELRPNGYRGAVVGEVGDGVSGPSRVVAQEPEAGREGYEGQLVRLTVSEPYPAGMLEQNPECLDRTQSGPGGKPKRWRARGTHQGEFRGIAPTGKEIEMTGIGIFRFSTEGKVVESWDAMDQLGMMQQLGVVEQPSG